MTAGERARRAQTAFSDLLGHPDLLRDEIERQSAAGVTHLEMIEAALSVAAEERAARLAAAEEYRAAWYWRESEDDE